MNENETGQNQWGQAVHPEVDDTANPTEAAPEDTTRGRGQAGREMLVQLQQMIDTLATQAAPVMREVAAKAAELAAVAGEKAGPLAHRAAGMTENVGQRVAARSKELATELRQPKESDADMAGATDTQADAEVPSDSGWTTAQADAQPSPFTDEQHNG